MKIGQHNFNRVSKKMLCPVCEHPDWCLVRDDGERAICTRVKSNVRREAYSGWLHIVGSLNYKKPKYIVKSKPYSPDYEFIGKVYKTLNFSPAILRPLVEKWNIHPSILINMGVGCLDDVYHFPMYNADKQLVGLKRRRLTGDKWCLGRSQLGVYLHRTFKFDKPAYICEGESDMAVMAYRDYNVIGKPCATAGNNILVNLLRKCPEITIIADYDIHGLGYKEACKLAKMFLCPVYVMLNRKYKDIREWLNSGTFTHKKFMKLRKGIT